MYPTAHLTKPPSGHIQGKSYPPPLVLLKPQAQCMANPDSWFPLGSPSLQTCTQILRKSHLASLKHILNQNVLHGCNAAA